MDKLKSLEQIIDKDPTNFNAHMKLAQNYLDNNNQLEAFSILNKTMKRFPKKALPLIKIGDYYYKNNDYISSYHSYQKAVEIESNSYEAWIGLSRVYKKLDDKRSSLKAVNEALKLKVNDIDALQLFLLLKIEAKRYKEAEKCANQLLNLSNYIEDINFTRFYLGLISIKKKLYLKAISNLQQIPSNSKYYGPVLNNLAICFSEINNIQLAEKTFNTLLEENNPELVNIRKDPTIWINHGLLMESNKKFDEALKSYQTANILQNNAWPYMESMKEKFIIKDKNTNKNSENKLEGLSIDKNKDKFSGLKYALYLGCLIPNRYPMIEAATRRFLNKMKVEIDEMEGASCCPAPGVFRSFDTPTWLTLAARNITIAEEKNDDILALCNGCYGTLLEANHALKENSEEALRSQKIPTNGTYGSLLQKKRPEVDNEQRRNEVNSHLKKIGKEYKGTSKVKHIIEIMYFELGKEKLIEKIKKKWNMDVAIHYGCHILKPTNTKPWGNEFEEPSFFDELVELTGCKSLDYKDKNMCCGAGGGLRAANKPVAIDFTFEKLRNMREAGAQAIITCCPFCHFQFDVGQKEVNNLFKGEIDEPFNIPIIYITQLFDYCFEEDLYDIGLLKSDFTKGVTPSTSTLPLFYKYYEII
ncbi:MAG: hypothetical protein GY870_20360 [archaeon]|nr:hypothetical protein [archaeon]